MVPGAQQQITEISDSGGRLFLCELLKEGEKTKNSNQICSLTLIKVFHKRGWKRCSQGSKSPLQNQLHLI